MRSGPARSPAVILLTALLSIPPCVVAQSPGDPMDPLPRRTRPLPEGDREDKTRDEGREEDDFIPESDLPWGLERVMAGRLAETAQAYRDYALRFVCRETVRAARYDSSGEASKEKIRRYDYYLERKPEGEGLREYRERVKRSGRTTSGKSVVDDEGFPPAYGWSFLFSRFNQQYFVYRELDTRFEGFHLIKEIQFKGSVPFTDGKDIRQWEGVALIDATTYAPIEIRAEPSDQRDRIRAMYDRWTRSFNLIGVRLAPTPMGYRCRVQFLMRKDGLTFPTDLRYDTFRAVGPDRTAPIKASTRRYRRYRFFKTETIETPGEPVSR